MKPATGAALALLLTAVAHGQSPAPVAVTAPNATEESGVVLRFDVDLVQMDAVVTDKNGRHVPTLKPEDFVVTQDDVTREIRHFSYVSSGSGGAAHTLAALAPSEKLRKDQVQRTVVVLIDDEHMDAFEDFVFVQQAVVAFIERSVRPGDMVSLLRVSRGSGAMQQFSADAVFLRIAARHMVWKPPPPPNMRTPVISVLLRAIRALAALPGRKTIVWVGPGIDNGDTLLGDNPLAGWREMRTIADFANRASVTIDTIHTVPLPEGAAPASQAEPPYNVVPKRGAPPVVPPSMKADVRYFRAETQMIELADMTAGLFQPYVNDLTSQLSKAVDDSDGYYLLGWYPGADAFGATGRHAVDYHKVQIRVKSKGLKVRTRMGYYARPGTAIPRTPFESEARAEEELFSPFQSGDFDVRLTASVEPSGNGAVVKSLLHIAPGGLEFHPDATLADCAIANLQYLVSPLLLDWHNNDPPLVQWRDYAVRLCGESRVRALKEGLAATLVTPIPKPGAYQIRAAVRNLPPGWQPHPPSEDAKVLTNRIDPIHIPVGSASESLEIPDLSKADLALAGLNLRASGGPPDQPGEVLARVASAGDPAVRSFHAGDSLEYQFLLVQRGVDAQTRIEVQHDGKTVYTSDPLGAKAGEVFSGVYRIDASFTPGQYLLGVVARRPGAKDNRAVAKWIDFEVVK